MKLQRKVYANRGEKVVDLLIGMGVWHIVNIVLGIGFAALSGVLTGVSNDPNLTSVIGMITMAASCVPFLINIALLIFFGLTRHWIALGMLGTFVFYLLITICLLVVFGAACFAMLGGMSGSGL